MGEEPNEPTQGDPLIDEVRAVRKAIAAQFENDIDKLCDELQRREQEHPDRIAKPAPVRGR